MDIFRIITENNFLLISILLSRYIKHLLQTETMFKQDLFYSYPDSELNIFKYYHVIITFEHTKEALVENI